MKTVIIGDGKQRNFLQKKIEQENLTDHVQLVGSLSRNEVMEYMQQTKVFFHPSTYESFGFVFVEALANGTQIISRPVGIAEASERWQIGNTSDYFFEKIKNVLEKPNSDEADYPYPISETLRKYLEIYHSSELKKIQ